MVKWVGSAGLLLVLSVTNVHQVVAAEPSKKEAWEYSLDERLAMRFGPDTGAPVRRPEDRTAESDAEKDKGVSVEGARNPELLLPFELFQRLLGRAYGPHEISRQIYREGLDPLLQTLGFEDGFWEDLELMADNLLNVDRERRQRTQKFATLSDHEREEVSRKINELQETYCQDRARILAIAESTFGKERFHKFLYQGVAPSGLVTTSGVTAQQMRFIAGGCQ